MAFRGVRGIHIKSYDPPSKGLSTTSSYTDPKTCTKNASAQILNPKLLGTFTGDLGTMWGFQVSINRVPPICERDDHVLQSNDLNKGMTKHPV